MNFSSFARFAQVTILGCFLTALPAIAQDNLLPNGGFEDWAQVTSISDTAFRLDHREAPVNWLANIPHDITPAGDEARPLLIRDAEIKRSGELSARVEIPDPTVLGSLGIRPDTSRVWAPAPVQIEPGKSYIARGWLRGADVVSNEKGEIMVMNVLVGGADDFFGGANNNRTIFHKVEWQEGSDWFPFEFEFQTSDSEVTMFFAIAFRGSGKFWIDDLEVVQAP